MKRLSESRRWHLSIRRRQHDRAIIKVFRARRRAAAARRRAELEEQRGNADYRVYSRRAPEQFNIKDPLQRAIFLDFLNSVSAALSRKRRVFLDFSLIKKVDASGMIVFMANLETWLAASHGAVTCNYPNDAVVEQLFQHVGILQRLGLSTRRTIDAENVRHWAYHTGEKADARFFATLLSDRNMDKSEGDDGTVAELFAGISEAIANAVEHAYTGAKESRWWFFSQFRDDGLEVVVCDLGDGIPDTMSRKPAVRDYLAKHTIKRHKFHTTMIKRAVTEKVSRTGLSYRGKGLPEMLESAKRGRFGGLAIFSHRGFYVYDSRNSRSASRDYKDSIKGTVINFSSKISMSVAI